MSESYTVDVNPPSQFLVIELDKLFPRFNKDGGTDLEKPVSYERPWKPHTCPFLIRFFVNLIGQSIMRPSM